MRQMQNKSTRRQGATIIGPYRFHNFGDDLIGAVMIKELESINYRVLLPKLSKENCEWLGIDSVLSLKYAIDNSEVLIIGGGGILGDSGIKPDNYYLKLALRAGVYGKIKGRKAIVTAVGAGPLKMSSSKLLVKALSILVSKIGVRDKESAQFLKKQGINKNKILQGADIALLWKDKLVCDVTQSKKIGIQFDVDSYTEDTDKMKVNIIKETIKEFIKKRTDSCALVTNGNYDSQLLDEKYRQIDQMKYAYLPAFLAQLSGLKVIITSHLHLAIAAYAARIPCYSIYVREKTRRFYEQIGHPERAISIKDADKNVINHILRQIENAKWTNYDETRLRRLKKEAAKLVDFKSLFR